MNKGFQTVRSAKFDPDDENSNIYSVLTIKAGGKMLLPVPISVTQPPAKRKIITEELFIISRANFEKSFLIRGRPRGNRYEVKDSVHLTELVFSRLAHAA